MLLSEKDVRRVPPDELMGDTGVFGILLPVVPLAELPPEPVVVLEPVAEPEPVVVPEPVAAEPVAVPDPVPESPFVLPPPVDNIDEETVSGGLARLEVPWLWL